MVVALTQQGDGVAVLPNLAKRAYVLDVAASVIAAAEGARTRIVGVAVGPFAADTGLAQNPSVASHCKGSIASRQKDMP